MAFADLSSALSKNVPLADPEIELAIFGILCFVGAGCRLFFDGFDSLYKSRFGLEAGEGRVGFDLRGDGCSIRGELFNTVESTIAVPVQGIDCSQIQADVHRLKTKFASFLKRRFGLGEIPSLARRVSQAKPVKRVRRFGLGECLVLIDGGLPVLRVVSSGGGV